jgi:ABC-type nitrate/sulfonate/bicarbonate transport system ATPase subunit/ABC-type nitrate/sulfonate/bicarbonate transport system permease component
MSRFSRAVQYLAGFAAFILLWWGGSLLVGPAVLPTPAMVAGYISSLAVLGSFGAQVAKTAARGLVGFSLAWAVALPVGLVMGRQTAGERLGFFPLLLLQSAPPLFWVTPLVLWLGTDGLVAPVVAFLVSLPLLAVHAATAVRHIPEYEHDVFAVYAPRPVVVARELYLPHLLPAVKSNIHLGLLVSIKASMLAEWFAAQDGFGRTIRIHYQFFAMTEFVGWALLFLVVIGGVSFGVRAMLSRALPARRATDTSRLRRESQPTQAELEEQSRGHRIVPPGREREVRPLEVRELSFGYGREPLFTGVSLSAEPGRPLVLTGESGCGKTTLLKCIAGIVRPWSGMVGTPKPVGLVFQEDALLEHRDALGNVLLPSMPTFTADDVERAVAALELWGLSGHGEKFPSELSGGMRKRLSMARAWYFSPSVLLLDEPFVNLDREARVALWELLLERLTEAAVPAVIVTHYPEEIHGYDVDVIPWRDLTAARPSPVHSR